MLNLPLAALYLSISRDSLLNYVAAGDIVPVRPTRPNVRRAHRQRPVNTDTLRKLLFDKNDLDRLADTWRGTA